MVQLKRQSPWAKLWLLTAAETFQPGQAVSTDVGAWAHEQLADKHEVVRAEAAWYLAGQGILASDSHTRLYAEATSTTRPAFGAAFARSGLASTSNLAKAVRGESPLASKAFEWGLAQ